MFKYPKIQGRRKTKLPPQLNQLVKKIPEGCQGVASFDCGKPPGVLRPKSPSHPRCRWRAAAGALEYKNFYFIF
jgi:hypothetical protein